MSNAVPTRRIPGVVYRDAATAARHLADGSWLDLTWGEALRRSAARVPERVAFASESGQITFRELDEQSDRLGGALLALGLQPGERALFQMGTVIDTAIALFACFKAGVIPVCTIPQYREIEIGQLGTLSGASAYFVQADFSAFDLVGFAQGMMARLPSLKHLVVARAADGAAVNRQEDLIARTDLAAARARLAAVALSPADCFAFQLSGGSTGVPKIIPRFHGEYLAHSIGWTRAQDIDEHAVTLWALPILHNAGMIYALARTVVEAGSTVLLGKPDIALMLAMIEKHRVTHTASIGPIAPQLLGFQDMARFDLSSLRYFIAMNRADAVEKHLAAHCTAKAANLYGITEGLVMVSPPGAPPSARFGTQGRITTATDEVVIREVATGRPLPPGEQGELTFRGPSSLTGYYNAPDLTRETLTDEGFVRTGDLVRAHVIDGHTYYAFEGRLKDNINRGGEKFGTEEVENLARAHPAIADIAVVAMPDPVYMERACAFVIARPGTTPPDVRSLGEHLIGRGLAKFKLPERVEIVDAFPVTRVGKLDRARLRAIIAEKLAAGR